MAKRILIALWFLLSLTVAAQQPVVRRIGDWVPHAEQLRGSMQGMAISGHHAVTLRHGGQCVVLDLRRHRATAIFDLTGNTTHCNNASFGGAVAGQRMPLLYVSSCFGDKACHVTRLTDSGATTIQRIFYDSDCFPVAQDWCVEADSGYLYAFGGRRGGMMYLKKFRLPDTTPEEVHLTDNDVLQTTPVTCVKVAQGSKIHNGHAYLPDGDEPGGYYLHVVEIGSGREVRTIDLNAIGLEPEGVDVRGRWIYVSFNTPDPADNKIYRFRK